MYMIERKNPGPEYFRVFNKSVKHIQEMMDKNADKCSFSWLRYVPIYPSFDSFVFLCGNQVFSVLIDFIDEKGKSTLTEQELTLFNTTTSENNLIACLFKIRINDLSFVNTDWNLFLLENGNKVNPLDFVTDKKVKMSDWELNNCAVNIAMNLKYSTEITKVDSFVDALGIMPQMWFTDKNGLHNWVIVKYCVYPENPDDLQCDRVFVDSMVKMHPQFNGYIAKIGFKPEYGSIMCRSCPFLISYQGLQQIYKFQQDCIIKISSLDDLYEYMYNVYPDNIIKKVCLFKNEDNVFCVQICFIEENQVKKITFDVSNFVNGSDKYRGSDVTVQLSNGKKIALFDLSAFEKVFFENRH